METFDIVMWCFVGALAIFAVVAQVMTNRAHRACAEMEKTDHAEERYAAMMRELHGLINRKDRP